MAKASHRRRAAVPSASPIFAAKYPVECDRCEYERDGRAFAPHIEHQTCHEQHAVAPAAPQGEIRREHQAAGTGTGKWEMKRPRSSFRSRRSRREVYQQESSAGPGARSRAKTTSEPVIHRGCELPYPASFHPGTLRMQRHRQHYGAKAMQGVDIKAQIRTVPDFPKPGVMFRDITTLLKRADGFHAVVEKLVQRAPATRSTRSRRSNHAASSSVPRSLTSSMWALYRSASKASCQPKTSVTTTSSNMAQTDWRSTVTRFSAASACCLSTT